MIVFIPYQSSEASSLARCAASLSQWLVPKPSRVTVVGPPLPEQVAHELKALDVDWLDQAKVIPGLTPERMPVIPFKGQNLAPLYFQRYLAWALADQTPDLIYAVCRPNVVLLNQVTLVTENAVVLHSAGTVDPANLQAAHKLVGNFDPPASFSQHLGVFHRTILQQLLLYIQKPKPWRRFYDSILDCINLDVADRFCEFNTYAWFASLLYPQNSHIQPVSLRYLPRKKAEHHDANVADANNRAAQAIVYEDLPTPVVSLATLGINGRFGNQIFQYAFLRILAKHHGFTVQTPAWVGQHLFGHRDPPVTAALPRIMESRDFPNNSYPAHLFDQPPANQDLWGYFQFDTHHYAPHKDFFRSLFRPTPAIEAPLRAALDRLVAPGRTLVALHIRRGDYEPDGVFFAAPVAWYRTLLEKIWPTLRDPILYIASDEPAKVLPDFQDYHPISAADLGAAVPEAPFYPDFYVLSQADLLAISNSSFSFLPAMLNERATAFYRPHLHQKEMIPFDPWNSPTLLHRELSKIPPFMQPVNSAPQAAASSPPPAPPGVQVVGRTATGAPIVSFGRTQ